MWPIVIVLKKKKNSTRKIINVGFFFSFKHKPDTLSLPPCASHGRVTSVPVKHCSLFGSEGSWSRL